MEAYQADLGRACERLGVEKDVRELAEKMLDRCASLTEETSQGGDHRRLRLACLLYLSAKVRRRDDSPRTWGIREILQEFDLSIADFLQELPILVKEATPTLTMLFGEDIEGKLGVRELQTAFVHSLVLGKKARDIFERFFNLPTGAGDQVAPILRLTWLLFILAKAELLGALPDLVSSFNLLVCVSNTILAHIPRALGTVDFTDTAKFPVRTEAGHPDTLASIAMLSKTSLVEIKPMAANLETLMQDLLRGVITADPNFAFPDGRVEAGRVGFPGLLGDPGTEKALELLDRLYDEKYRKVGEIDERSFIRKKETEVAATKLATSGGVGSATPPSMTKCQVGTPMRSTSLQLGTPMRLLHSPLRPANSTLKTPSPVRMGPSSYFATPGGLPRTPLSESMQLTAWLRETLANCPAEPSEALLQFFKACDEDVSAGIIRRVHDLSATLFPMPQGPTGVACMQSAMARERKLEGVKLYYRVLENMVKAEETRTGKRNFTVLLNHEVFHKCVLACSFEMVVASYRMASLTFPSVLERLQLKAFDLCKVIETFVRHEPLLPRELKRHLFNIEEKMLESLVWERGSSLYPKLISTCTDTPGRPQVSLQSVADAMDVDRAPNVQSPPSNKPAARRRDQVTPTKRSREGSPEETEVSPTKLQKGRDSSRVPPSPPANNGSPPERRPVGLMGGLLSPLRPSGQSAFQAFMSPMRPSTAVNHAFMGPLPTCFGEPTEHLDRPGRAIIGDFLRKVLKLGLLRLEDLCDRLDFDDNNNDRVRSDILTQVYTMVQHVIYHHTHMLYNRHLDQILLSALYGICKVNHLKKISFKEIIQHYKKQPQAKTDIFRTVIIAQSEPDMAVTKTGDIIEFYNTVFIPTVKQFVLQLGQKKAPLVKPGSLGQGTARRTLMSPAGPHAGLQTPPPADSAASNPSKVFVSPLRQSPKQPFLTPRSRIFYHGRMGESTNAYQSPSKDLKYINNRIAAHSQLPAPQPVVLPQAPVAPPAVSETRAQSSDRSCSTGPSSAEEAPPPPARSQTRYAAQANGRPRRAAAGGGSQPDHSSHMGMSGLDMMARAAARPSGNTRLDDLTEAAMMMGDHQSDREESPVTSPSSTRRSRRQAGRAPQ